MSIFKRKMKKRLEEEKLYEFAGELCEKFNTDQSSFYNIPTSSYKSYHINTRDESMWLLYPQGHRFIRVSTTLLAQLIANFRRPTTVMTRHYMDGKLGFKLTDPTSQFVSYMELSFIPEYKDLKKKAARICEFYNDGPCATDLPLMKRIREEVLAIYANPTVMTYIIDFITVTFVITENETARHRKITDMASVRLLNSVWFKYQTRIPAKTTCGCGSHISTSSIKSHRKSKKHMVWIDTTLS